MTNFRARGGPSIEHHAGNVVDLPQETALIRDLRRLQRHVERECEHGRYPHATEVARFEYRGETGNKAPEKTAPGAVDRLLDALRLDRHKAIAASSPREEPSAVARHGPCRNTKAPPNARPREKSERLAPPPTNAETGSVRTRRAHEDSPIFLADRIRIPLSGESGGGLFARVIALLEFLRPAQAYTHMRSAFGFLIGREQLAGAEQADTTLTTQLTRGFEVELRIGLRVLIAGVAVFGGWAILIPMSGAVVVPGTLVVESDLKKIQHPAGGVVANIPVRDGMHVRAGDLLLRLDETQLRANAQVLAQQLDQMRVRLARLIAEREGLEQPQMPHELASRSGDNDLSRLWASEVSLFNSRAAARRSAKELLSGNVAQLGEQISGLDAQAKSKTAQRDLISGEREGVDGLYQKGLVPLTRKTSLQREAARLDGERGQVVAAIAEAKSKISEAELKAVKIDQDFHTDVMKDLREAQDKTAELVEKTAAAQDLLRRVDLRAPTNGIVHQLSVHTIGGVITPGEVVMEIVPESDELQIEAKLPPQEIDHVHRGQRAYTRFSAFNQRTTPQLEGVVSYVSADLSRERLANANAGAAYYTVRVTLPSSERRRLGGLQLVSGMPVEVFLQTGSRTLMSYLLKPISDQLARTFN
jgi:HlyD family secretion protein